MEKGEFIPVNEDVISNPSTKEGKDEGMSTIDDEVTNEFNFLVAMEARKYMSRLVSSTDNED